MTEVLITSAIEITWEDPPAEAPSRSCWGKRAAFLEALRTNPGRWAVYPFTTLAPSSAVNAAHRFRGEPGCEALVRRVDGERRVYVRYTAPDGAP